MPRKYRALYRRALSGRSLKASIRAHCLMCVGWDSAEVRLCTASTCPLYPHRLGYGAADKAAKEADLCGQDCDKSAKQASL